MLKYENPQLQNLANKDAIVVASFGTTFKETREKTIEATVRDIQAAHPGVKVVTAFTSHIIIDRIEKNEGKKYPTPEEALTQLKADGYSRIALVSLDVIPGMEYSYVKAVFNEYKEQFKTMTCGTSLMVLAGGRKSSRMTLWSSSRPSPASSRSLARMRPFSSWHTAHRTFPMLTIP